VSDFLFQYGLFLAKALTGLLVLLAALGGLFALLRAARGLGGQDSIEVKNLNERYQQMADVLRADLLSDDELKKLGKQRKAEAKQRQQRKADAPSQPRVFALRFDGDLRASAVEELREEISTVLQVAQAGDEVLIRLESEGGMVHGYGLAASQLARIRQHGIRLTAAVDKVAASGGYMMACVADRILAAPFAIVGSIGVVAQLPNFHRLLERSNIDYELHTAGAFKRTLTLFGENTDEGRAKFKEEIEQTHQLFKAFVGQHRPQLDMDQVATGEHWFGTQALELKLVDALQTSDDYLLQRIADADLYEVRYRRRHTLSQRLTQSVAGLSRGLRDGIEGAATRRWR
jgi:serine protease SohB